MVEERYCRKCGAKLRSSQSCNYCDPCQAKLKKKAPFTFGERSYDERYYDLEQMRQLLGLDSYEQARRKAHEIPGKVPGIRRHLFDMNVVDAWMKTGSAAPTGVKNLSPATADALKKVSELAGTLEKRLPLTKVVQDLEKQLPIQEVTNGLAKFIKSAPPPDKVISEIIESLIHK